MVSCKDSSRKSQSFLTRKKKDTIFELVLFVFSLSFVMAAGRVGRWRERERVGGKKEEGNKG